MTFYLQESHIDKSLWSCLWSSSDVINGCCLLLNFYFFPSSHLYITKTYNLSYFCTWHKGGMDWSFHFTIFFQLSFIDSTVIFPLDLRQLNFIELWFAHCSVSLIKWMVRCVNMTTDLFNLHHNQSWDILLLQREILSPLENYLRVLILLVLGNHKSTFYLYRFPYYLTVHVNGIMYHTVFGF